MSPRQQKVIEILKSGGWHSVREFVLAGTGVDYRSRISELRKLGYEFENRQTETEGGRVSEWRLLLSPAEVAPPPRVTFDDCGQGRLC